jgi:hypothetical protein
MSGIPNSRSTSINFQEVVQAKGLIVKETLFDRLNRHYFGDDIFISHSRIDGINYSRSLARLLQKKYRFKCYADFHWTESGEELPQFLIRKLKRSTILVVVISKGAVNWSKNIKEEIDIFKKTKRPVFIIDLDNSYNKNQWTELHGINVVKEYTELNNLAKPIRKPSVSVLQGIRDSFKYITKYNQQRSAARVAFSLIILSVLTAIITGVFALQMMAQAVEAKKDRDNAFAEKELANQEKDLAKKETIEIKENLNHTKDKLTEAEKDLSNTTAEKQKAENDRAKANQLREIAENQTLVAQNEAKEAQRITSEWKAGALGAKATYLATNTNDALAALKQAVLAVDTGKQLNPTLSIDNMSEEVKKGLTNAIIAMDFRKAFKIRENNDQSIIEILDVSPNGELILGKIKDVKNQSEKIVIWEFENTFRRESTLYESYASRTLNSDILSRKNISDYAEAKFSPDGKWIVVAHGKLEIWKISNQKDKYQFSKDVESKNEIFQANTGMDSLTGRFSISSDGKKIAVFRQIFGEKEGLRKPEILILSKKGQTLELEFSVLLPDIFGKNHYDCSIAFTKDNSLILLHHLTAKYTFKSGKFTSESSAKFTFYNLTENKLIQVIDEPSVGFSFDYLSRWVILGVSKEDEYIVRGTQSKNILKFSKDGKLIERYLGENYNIFNGRIVNANFDNTKRTVYIPYTNFLKDTSISEYFITQSVQLGFPSNAVFLSDNNSIGVLYGNGINTLIRDKYSQKKITENYKVDLISPSSSLILKPPLISTRNPIENKCPVIKDIGGVAKNKTVLIGDKYLGLFFTEDFSLSIFDVDSCKLVQKLLLEKPQINADLDSDRTNLLIVPYITNGILALFIESGKKTEKNDIYAREIYLIKWNVGIIFPYKQDLPIKYELNHLPEIIDDYLSIYGISVESKDIVLFERNKNQNCFLLTLKNGRWERISLEADSKEAALFSYPPYLGPPGLPKYTDIPTISLVNSRNPIAFSKNNDLVINLDGSGVLRVWDTKTGIRKLTLVFPKSLTGDILDIKSKIIMGFTNDGKHIRIIFKDGKIRYYPTSIEDYYKMAKEMIGEEIKK